MPAERGLPGRGPALFRGRLCLNLTQSAALGVKDEPSDPVASGQLATRAQPRETVTQGCLDVLERAESPSGQDAVGGERLGELVLGGTVQTAAVVHHDDDLLGAELAVGDAKRAERIVGLKPASVADDVRVATLQTEHREEVYAGVNAGQHRHAAAWLRAQAGRSQRLCARAGNGEHLIGVCHQSRSYVLATRSATRHELLTLYICQYRIEVCVSTSAGSADRTPHSHKLGRLSTARLQALARRPPPASPSA